MISASAIGVVLFFMDVGGRCESGGQRSQCAVPDTLFAKNAKTTPCTVEMQVLDGASPVCETIDSSGKTGATIYDRQDISRYLIG
jgi:hypothetical protein